MKQPTHDLEEEHGGILLMLKIIEKIRNKIGDGKTIDKTHLIKVVEFLKNFVDRCHHGKEEDILFPALAKDPSQIPLINHLLGEHKAGRDYVGGIATSLDNFQAGNPDAYHISENMTGYINLLTRHIKTENDTLFPLADRQLPEELQKQIEERFEQLERDVIGVGKHEEYHSWLEELKQIYLPLNR